MNSSCIESSSFVPVNGVAECHTVLHVPDVALSFEDQVAAVFKQLEVLKDEGPENSVPVFMRIFLSDAANQAALAGQYAERAGCACSVVEQPLLDGSKIALWVYWQEGATVMRSADGLYEVYRGKDYIQYWSVNNTDEADGSYDQTRNMLENYARKLDGRGLTLADNCLRTWFFVRDVDVNYAGVVKGRNEVFARRGLSPKTHFIASTGIGGRQASAHAKVMMDAYAVKGLHPDQIHYLYAPTHLNPTYEYGVSFERGTYVDYGDRRHVFISGTASINNRGEIVHPGDVDRQVERMWENVGTLLAEAGCGFEHVNHMLVYLRDIADYAFVSRKFHIRFPHVPKVFLLAPVCRSGWLVEMECMACKETGDSRFAPF